MSGGFYVYEHWRPDLDVCFYVGKGKGRRASVMHGRGAHHTRIQKKLIGMGMCVEIRMVACDLEEEDAFDVEIEKIAFWREQGILLTNRTDGGEGASNPVAETRAKMRAAKIGKKLSEEHRNKIKISVKAALADVLVREKLSKAAKSSKNVAHAKKLHSYVPRTKEHYEKVSAALTGKKLSPERIEKTRSKNIGRVQSPETIERRRKALIGKKRDEDFCAKMRALWTPERKARHADKMQNNKELLEKMAKSNIGNKHTLGKRHSEETKAKMRAAHKRNRIAKEGIA